MLRVAGQTLYPFPAQPGCDFTSNYMIYARLTVDTTGLGPVYLVDSFRVLSNTMTAADRKQFFLEVMSGNDAPGQFDIPCPSGAGFGYNANSPQFFLPAQCLLAIHLDDTIQPYSPTEPGIQNGFDEGDANATLICVDPNGDESPTPSANVRIVYFSAVRRSATDMRGMYLSLDSGGKGMSSLYDPDGGNSGGTPYPPPGSG